MNQQINTTLNPSFKIYWVDFLRTCLKPLIRILIRNRVEFNSFISICKELYIDEAENYINQTSDNSRGKISSIAHKTGLDRREVSKYLKNPTTKSDLIENSRSREAVILEHWTHMEPYCDSNGQAIPLKRSGKGLSFETLCQRFGKNISHGPILESLLKAKCVKIKDNKVHFVTKSFTPPKGINEDMAKVTALSIKRIVDTIHHNIYGDMPPNFQRNLYSIRIPNENIPIFRKEINKLIRRLYSEVITPEFDKIEAKYESLNSRNKNNPVGLGIFYFED